MRAATITNAFSERQPGFTFGSGLRLHEILSVTEESSPPLSGRVGFGRGWRRNSEEGRRA
jgi:hypothetical protein